VLMRSAGCAINDYADRDFDGHVARTAQRPLATGLVSPREALVVFVLLSLLAFALVLTLNARTIAFSFVAVALAATYPFMKRFTHMPQLVLGIAFGWAVPMAFTALQDQTPPVAWVLFAATVTWALIYDTMYAMVDREDDLKVGIKSTAILFGRHDRLVIGLLQVLMLALLWWVGELAAREPNAYFHVISKDKGFDPLIRHLKERKIRVQRETDLGEIPVLQLSDKTSMDEKISAIIKNLGGRGQSRPRKVKTLQNTINSLFTKSLDQKELNALVSEMKKRRLIVVNQNNVSYKLPH